MFRKLENFTRKIVANIKVKINKIIPRDVSSADITKDVISTIIAASIVMIISPEVHALSLIEAFIVYAFAMTLGFSVMNTYTRRFAGNAIKQLVSVA